MSDESFTFTPIPEPEMKVGHRVDVFTPDGIGRYVVTDVEGEDEDGVHRLRLTTAPLET